MPYSRPEPLRGKHSLEGFQCGEESLDRWLERHARRAEADGTARVFVTTEDGAQVVGYYALAAAAVGSADATERLRKGQPAARPIPVMLLARLAVDRKHQGGGVGRSLLQDALLKCEEAAELVAARAVTVNAINEGARDFYRRFGFEDSPTDPLHLILLMKDLTKLFDQNRP